MPPVKTPSEPDAAIAFITALFGEERTKSRVYFCSLANDKPPPAGQKPEYRLTTRDAAQLHQRKWDVTLGGYRKWVNWFARSQAVVPSENASPLGPRDPVVVPLRPRGRNPPAALGMTEWVLP